MVTVTGLFLAQPLHARSLASLPFAGIGPECVENAKKIKINIALHHATAIIRVRFRQSKAGLV